MTIVFSTDDVAMRDRFEFWRDSVCSSYVPLDCATTTRDNFDGTIELHRLSKISASFVNGSGQTVRRRKRDIGKATEASFLISLQLSKNGILEQSDRRAELKPGDFGLYSSIDRYALTLPDGFKQLVVQVPRAELLQRLPNADQLTGTVVSGSSDIGKLVNDSVVRLVRNVENANEAMLHCLQESIIDLVATGFASLTEVSYELSQPERMILMRAKAYIRDNLKDPELDRAVLARSMGLSVRRLSEIFHSDGSTIAATIREMRLRQIAADLVDPRYARTSISQLAIKWGVYNLSSFSRMFQSQYGTSPRAYRDQGLPRAN